MEQITVALLDDAGGKEEREREKKASENFYKWYVRYLKEKIEEERASLANPENGLERKRTARRQIAWLTKILSSIIF